jgi:protein transport protein SEC24
MADHSTYHALAQPGAPGDDPRRRASQPQVAAPNFNPSVAPGPQGYHQARSPYAGYGGNVQQSPYGGVPQAGLSPAMGGQEPGYFPQGAAGSQGANPMGGITSQMGGLAVGDDGSGSMRAPKKKQHRHAYHDLTPAGGSSQAFNGMPQGGFGDSTQYLNSAHGQQAVAAENAYAAQQPSPGYAPYGAATQGRVPSLGSSFQPADQAVAGSAQGKVDPEQIPSVPKSRDVPAQYYFDHVYPTMERHLPPPATIPFVAHDQGNSSPKFARLTLNNIPSTAESLASTGLPLGLILQPLASLQAGEQPVPVLDFGEQGPPRCRRCRAYINPFMTFRSGGNKLVCNMCTFPNDVAPEYFAPTDPSGIRVDRMQRPELMMGTVEFMVPKEYWAKEPVGLRWLFLIDVCQESVNKGYLEAFCEGIITALYSNGTETETDETTNEDGENEGKRLPAGSKVGIVTYDKDMHFYNLSVRCNPSLLHFYSNWVQPHLSQAQMMVMTDLEDPFVPLSEGLFVDPYESK